MKKSVKVLSQILIVVMMASFVTACAGNAKDSATNTESTSTSSANPEKKLEQVKLTILTGGEQSDQPGFQAVADEIARLTADTINVKIDVQTYAWGDYTAKVNTMLAAGQNVDIYLSFGGAFQQDVDKKQIIPLDDLIEKYGPDLKKSISDDVWRDGMYQGKTYAVPALYPFVGIDAILTRQDLREKYKLPPITDIGSFENYLDTVVKGEKGMVGIEFRDGGRGFDLTNYMLNGESKYFGYATANYMNIGRISPDKPYKVENNFASPEMKKIIDWNRKAYANGWLAKDVLTQKDDLAVFSSGKSAVLGSDAYVLNSLAPVIEKNLAGAKVEAVINHDYSNMTRTQKINNFSVISSTSKNPERAMMFLNWLRENQDNYNLLMYGIKGKDWVPVGDKNYDLGPGIDSAKRPYNPTPWWFKNMNMDLNLNSSNPEFIKLYNTILGAKYTTPKLIDFTYDSSAVKTQISQISTVMLEKWAPVITGIKNTDADYEEALAALDKAGVPEVLADIQKQIDAWAAANDK